MGRRSENRRANSGPTEHPHGRGEKLEGARGGAVGGGTSPRAWGEVHGGRADLGDVRNIPTGVGRSHRLPDPNGRRPEHPHGRGEKWTRTTPPWTRTGTSPRAWGEENHGRPRDSSLRNIPTGVGRRFFGVSGLRSRPEHPHGRGEKHEPREYSLAEGGTSPRAWGEEGPFCSEIRGFRNIPTGVGRRSRPASSRPSRAEHPHGRGEKALSFRQSFLDAGTSPRAWGEGERVLLRLRERRNIPTGVGRSYSPRVWHLYDTEHPHGRGEKMTPQEAQERARGTSPRAWGEEVLVKLLEPKQRNIPTGVGRRTRT